MPEWHQYSVISQFRFLKNLLNPLGHQHRDGFRKLVFALHFVAQLPPCLKSGPKNKTLSKLPTVPTPLKSV